MKPLYAGAGTDDGAPMDRPVAQIDPVPRVSIQAFCESPDVAAVVSAAVSDRRMAKAHIKLNMGGAPAAVEAYKSAPTPNVGPRGSRRPRRAARATRGAGAILRRRDQGGRPWQAQRHRSLSAAHRAWGQRISGRPVRRRRVRSG